MKNLAQIHSDNFHESLGLYDIHPDGISSPATGTCGDQPIQQNESLHGASMLHNYIKRCI